MRSAQENEWLQLLFYTTNSLWQYFNLIGLTVFEAFYANQQILVTGGTGLIGRPLTEMLLAAGAKVTAVSLDDPSRAPAGVRFLKSDLRNFDNCIAACEGQDIVFNLAGG